MSAFIAPPPRIPFYLRWGLRIAQWRAGSELMPAQLLAWYPRAALGSAALEALITHEDGRLGARILKLVRMAVSFTVGCPFCVGMNSRDWETVMSADELAAVQGRNELGVFDARERVAIEYARLVSATPIEISPEFGATLTDTFTEREIVALATTIAQVNYWARFGPALGCPAEG